MKKYIFFSFLLLAPISCFGVEPGTEKLQEDANREERMSNLESLIVNLINAGKLDQVEAAVKEVAERPIKEMCKAINNNDVAAVAVAIAKGFDVNYTDASGETLLHKALNGTRNCCSSARGLVSSFFEKASIGHNLAYNDSKLGMINLLLRLGANPNAMRISESPEKTPLDQAVASCDDRIIEALLVAKADVSGVDVDKLNVGCNDRERIIKLLEQHKS